MYPLSRQIKINVGWDNNHWGLLIVLFNTGSKSLEVIIKLIKIKLDNISITEGEAGVVKYTILYTEMNYKEGSGLVTYKNI